MIQALLACVLLQNTWVVDDTPGPGVDFTDLPPAVAAAADGDILLVLPGTYSHFTLAGKGLRILGSGASSTIVANAAPTYHQTVVTAVPASSVSHLEGMGFTESSYPGTAQGGRVIVSGATTRATFADVEILGPPPISVCGVWPGLAVQGAEVHVARSLLRGGDGVFFSSLFCGPYASPGGTGLLAQSGARVHVASSVVAGGQGGNHAWTGSLPGGPGGPGIAAFSSSQVWIADSTVEGGDAGCTGLSSGGCSAGGAGIHAELGSFVRVSGDSTAWVRGGDSPASGGLIFPAGPGINSVNSVVEVHSVVVLGGCAGSPCLPASPVTGAGVSLNAPPLPILDVSGTLTLSGSATVALSNGPPNAAFAIVFAGGPGFVPGGSFFLGEVLIDPAIWFLLAAGSLSPAGGFSTTIPLAGLSPSFLYSPVHLQGLAFDPGGAFWRLSNSTIATIRP